MAQKQMAEQRADDRQPDTIGRYAVGGRKEASEDRTTADDRPYEPSGEIAGDAYGALIADQNA